jgi:hypothetical protein
MTWCTTHHCVAHPKPIGPALHEHLPWIATVAITFFVIVILVIVVIFLVKKNQRLSSLFTRKFQNDNFKMKI